MSTYKGSLLSAITPVMDGVKYTGQASGRWNLQEYIAALSENTWVKALTVPDAPVNVSAVAGNGVIDVAFSTPTDNGGDPITYYEVVVLPSNSVTTGNTSPIRVSGLTNGVAYSVNIHAVNSLGTGLNATISGVIPVEALYQLSLPIRFGTPRNTIYTNYQTYSNTYQGQFPGGNGPPIAEFQTYYNTNNPELGTLLSSNTNTYFEVPYDGVQVWTVPATRQYTFEVAGAPSGANWSASYGYPAKITASFNLTKGDIIWIIIGQRGTNVGYGPYDDAACGGFTLVAKGSDINNIANLTSCLICAGAGIASGGTVTNANYTVQSLTAYNIVKASGGSLTALRSWYYTNPNYYNSSGGFPKGGAGGTTQYSDCYVDTSATNVTKGLMTTLQAGYVIVS